jgi:tetratricopeptide (TPR) repeat protein
VTQPRIVQNVIAIGGFAYGAVYGDLHVHGDGRPVYTIEHFRSAARPPGDWLLQLPSRMLDARHGIVEFTGRATEIARLSQWRDGTDRLGVMFVHAPGGQGKSRLAAHFAGLCVAQRWKVLTARHGGDTITSPDGSQDLGAGEAPGLLLIVDYADRWPHSHLEWLLRNRLLHTPVKTRVLLLARSAGGWPAIQHALEEVYASTEDMALGPLGDDRQERQALFEQARDRFGELFGLGGGALPAPLSSTLDDPRFQLVLALHMAALVAVDAYSRGERAPTDPAHLTAYLLRREHAHWSRLFGRGEHGATFQTPPGVMAQAAFTATVTGAMPAERADAVLSQVGRDVSWPVAATRVRADHLVCYPATEPGAALEPLLPDRLGEDFLALTLPGHPVTGYEADPRAPGTLLRLLTESDVTVAPRAVAFLAAAAERWPHVGREHLFPLLRARPEIGMAAGGVALTAVAELPDVELSALESIEPLLPQTNTDFDLAACAIVERLTHHRLAGVTDPAQRAALQSQLVRRLSNVGRYADVLTVSTEMVDSYRRLRTDQPDGYGLEMGQALTARSGALAMQEMTDVAVECLREAIPILEVSARSSIDGSAERIELAGALAMLGAQLGGLERREESAQSAQRSVDLWWELCQEDPRCQPSLARAMRSLSERLAGLGRLRDAVAVAEHAAAIYRAYAEPEPEKFNPDLADALTVYARALAAVGELDASLTASMEALPIYRRLAEVNAFAYEPGLAQTLEQLGSTLQQLGSRPEALDARRECLEIRRKLASLSPLAWTQRVGNALANYAQALNELGRPDEALSVMEESIVLYGQLEPTAPEVYGPSLATILAMSASILGQLGWANRALTAMLRAVKLRRRPAEANPQAHQLELARSLNSLGLWLAAVGRNDEAVLAAREALSIVEPLADDDPDAYDHVLASALVSYAVSLRSAGRAAEAIQPGLRAVSIGRSLARSNPGVHLVTLANALGESSATLRDVKRNDEALELARESLSVRRRLAGETPAMFSGHVAEALSNLGSLLSDMQRHDEAIEAAEEGIEIWRRSSQAHRGGKDEGLANALLNLGSLYIAAGTTARATEVAAEAAEMLRRLASDNPGVLLPALSRALNNLCLIWSTVGRQAEYRQCLAELVEVLRHLVVQDEREFALDLAKALTNHGLAQREAGSVADSEPTLREALMWHRKVDEPGLVGRALANLAGALSSQGRDEEALGLTDEALGIFRRIGSTSDLADTLISQSIFLRALGTAPAGTLAPIAEAADLRRGLYRADPQAHRDGLVAVLGILVRALVAAERVEQALAVQQETITVLQDEPRGAAMAAALITAAQVLVQLGRNDDAAGHAERAVALARELGQDEQLVEALSTLTGALSRQGRVADAVGATLEAMTLQRRLALVNPDAYAVPAAMSAVQLSVLMAALSRWPQAAQLASEACTAWQALVAADPDHRPYLAHSRLSYANALANCGELGAAREQVADAVAIWRAIGPENPTMYYPAWVEALDKQAELSARQADADGAATALTEVADLHRMLGAAQALSATLLKLCTIFNSTGAHPRMLPPALEALDIQRQLTDADPGNLPNLISALIAAASAHGLNGSNAEALRLSDEAVRDARKLGPGLVLGDALYNFAWIRSGIEEDVAAALPAAIEAMALFEGQPAAIARTEEVLAEVRRLLAVQDEQTAPLNPVAPAAGRDSTVKIYLGRLQSVSPARWPAEVLLVGVVLVVAVAITALAVEPGALRTPDALFIPPAVVVLAGIYATFGVTALRRPDRGDGVGVVVGLVAGAMWCVEIFGGGPAMVSRSTEVAVGATFSLAAVAVSLAAGPIAALRYGTAKAAWRAGAFAGLASGALVFVFGVVMTLSTLDLLGTRSDYQAQLARSGAPDMPAFLVQDILAATCAHLIINAVLGLAGAGLAVLGLLAVRATRRTRPGVP